MELLIIPVAVVACVCLVGFLSWHSKRNARLAEESRLRKIYEDLEAEKRRREDAARELQHQATKQRNNQIQRFRDLVFPMSSENKDVMWKWTTWSSSMHDTDAQLNLQCRAVFWTSPVSIDTASKTGLFYETSGMTIETATLTHCTCHAFSETGLPCSHIYRLFHDITTDSPAIPEVVNVDAALMEKLNSVPASLRGELLWQIACIRDGGQNMKVSDAISAGVRVGLLTKEDATDYEPYLDKMTKDKLILALAKHGVKDFASSWTKVKLISWVMETQPDFLRFYFKDVAHISISPDAEQWAQGIRHSLVESPACVPVLWTDVEGVS